MNQKALCIFVLHICSNVPYNNAMIDERCILLSSMTTLIDFNFELLYWFLILWACRLPYYYVFPETMMCVIEPEVNQILFIFSGWKNKLLIINTILFRSWFCNSWLFWLFWFFLYMAWLFFLLSIKICQIVRLRYKNQYLHNMLEIWS
jgi:hypothetical protein